MGDSLYPAQILTLVFIYTYIGVKTRLKVDNSNTHTSYFSRFTGRVRGRQSILARDRDLITIEVSGGRKKNYQRDLEAMHPHCGR